jgi:hypothetical protein
MSEREQLEKDHALFVRRLLSRFLNQVNDPKARVVVKASSSATTASRRRSSSTASAGAGSGNTSTAPTTTSFAGRARAASHGRPLRIAYREPEGRWHQPHTKSGEPPMSSRRSVRDRAPAAQPAML